MARLAGKIALVTGAARGIGAGIARAFAAEGATVWVTDIDEAGAKSVLGELGESHCSARLDVREEADWERVTGAMMAEHQWLDILVNNAGITGFEDSTGPHDPEHASLDDWHRVHRVNLDGTFLGCKHAIRAMRAPCRTSQRQVPTFLQPATPPAATTSTGRRPTTGPRIRSHSSPCRRVPMPPRAM